MPSIWWTASLIDHFAEFIRYAVLDKFKFMDICLAKQYQWMDSGKSIIADRVIEFVVFYGITFCAIRLNITVNKK